MRTNRLPLRARIALVVLGPVLALAALVAGPPADATAVAIGARNWLALIALGYAASSLLAWFTRRSWNISLVRMLVWGLVAFLCISELVDLIGQHRELAWQILGADGGGDPVIIADLRWQLACWALGLLMSLTAIFVGFEEPEAENEA